MDAFADCKIDVIVFDSSDTNETKKVVDSFQKQGKKNLFYHFYKEEDVDRRSIDRKVYTACRMYAAQYEYLWVSSDSTVFLISKFWEELKSAMIEKCDYIVLHHIQEKYPQGRQYQDSRTFLLEYSWVMTLLGANIIATRHLLQAIQKYPVISGEDFWFWIPMSIFHLFANKRINAKVLVCPSPYIMNPDRKDPFWKQSGDVLWQWAKIWPKAVDALPPYYNGIKEHIIRLQEENMHLFTIKNLLSMRACGQISLQNVRKYRKYLPRVTKTPIFCFYCITILGNQRLLMWMKRFYKAIRAKGEHI